MLCVSRTQNNWITGGKRILNMTEGQKYSTLYYYATCPKIFMLFATLHPMTESGFVHILYYVMIHNKCLSDNSEAKALLLNVYNYITLLLLKINDSMLA